MADHQISHVYVRDPARVPEVRALLEGVAGVGEVLDEAGKREYGLDHERSGELVLIAEPDSWFTYYYWLDDAKAPDYARTVDIHRKPGYDPVELFLDPAIRVPPLALGLAAGEEEARLPHADGRDPARRDAGSRLARPDPRRPVEGPAADDPPGRPAARRRRRGDRRARPDPAAPRACPSARRRRDDDRRPQGRPPAHRRGRRRRAHGRHGAGALPAPPPRAAGARPRARVAGDLAARRPAGRPDRDLGDDRRHAGGRGRQRAAGAGGVRARPGDGARLGPRAARRPRAALHLPQRRPPAAAARQPRRRPGPPAGRAASAPSGWSRCWRPTA